MATNLNKSRIKLSKIALAIALLVIIFTKSFIEYESPIHEFIEFIGYFFVAVCVMGRLYSTAFLGGFKNEQLITYGAFSIVRNPLYFFSLLGITGVALMSGHILLYVFLPLYFLFLYNGLIAREEEFLSEKFGTEYMDYKKRVPRLFPKFSLYQAPEVIQTVPKFLNNAFKDAIWWFLPFPLFEILEYVQESGMISPMIVIP